MLPFDADPLMAARWPLILVGFLLLIRFLLPRSLVTPAELLQEVGIVVSAYLMYFVVRGAVEGREFEAFERAADIISLERAMGIFWEADLQGSIVGVRPIMDLANWTYLWGHWPVIIFVATWLFFLRRDIYPVYRNAFLISGAVGLIIFATLPVAPPRFMAPWGFVDTVASNSHAYLGPKLPILINEYAAMPSLHFGWNLLAAIAIVRHAPALPVKLLGIIMPVAMFLAIVLTGNHFIIDGIAGAIVALFGLVVAQGLRRWSQRADSPPGALPLARFV
jgi:hypothetical protein